MSIYSVSVCYCSHLCKVYWSAVNNWRKALFSNLDLFLSQAQKQHSTGKLQFLSTKLFMHVHQSLRATDCWAENLKPWVFLRNNVGTTRKNLRKTWFLEWFGSDSCVLWSAPHDVKQNKSNLLHEERDVGLLAVKMLRDLRGRVRSREACGCGKRPRWSESMYTQPVDMMWRIVAHNRYRDGSLKNATCARGIDWAKLNAWRGKSRSFSLFSSASRVH